MDAYSFGRLIPALIIFPGIPILIIGMFLNWRSKRRLKKIRENYSKERLERYNKKRKP